MLDDISDLFNKECKEEDLNKLLKEKLGIGFEECAQALCKSLKERASEIVEDLPSLAPYGDYSKMTETPEEIIRFLQDEASKVENWKISFIEMKKKNDQLIEFIFDNIAVDDGDVLKGFVFVGLSGNIRHSFCQAH